MKRIEKRKRGAAVKKLYEWLNGFRDAIPVGISVFAYGLAFGALARQAGLSYWETVAMSALVFAGSAQFAVIDMLRKGASMTSIILTTLMLNSRHLLMGASLRFQLGETKPWETAVLAHFLNDESYALTVARVAHKQYRAAYFLGVGFMTFVGWVLSSALSAAVGDVLAEPLRYALRFAFLGVFVSLLVPQIKDWSMALVFLVTAVTTIIASRYLPSGWVVLVGTFAAICAGLVMEQYATSDAELDRLDGSGNLSH